MKYGCVTMEQFGDRGHTGTVLHVIHIPQLRKPRAMGTTPSCGRCALGFVAGRPDGMSDLCCRLGVVWLPVAYHLVEMVVTHQLCN